MKWLVLVAVVFVGSYVLWELTRSDPVDDGSYEVVEVERYGITVKLAKNAEYCEATWDGYGPIPESAEWLGPQVYALPMSNEPGVYKEIYLTDGARGARAAGTESCWNP